MTKNDVYHKAIKDAQAMLLQLANAMEYENADIIILAAVGEESDSLAIAHGKMQNDPLAQMIAELFSNNPYLLVLVLEYLKDKALPIDLLLPMCTTN